MRKFVKPAHPDATIPDPSRGGDLPAAGLPCEWSVHWARLEMRGDVIVTDIEPEGPEPEAEAAAPEPQEDAAPAAQLPAPSEPAPADPVPATDAGAVASVPFMITGAQRRRLRALGKTDDEIAQMKPEEAQALLAAPDAPTA